MTRRGGGIVVLDDPTARAVGMLIARSGHNDVVDVLALYAAKRGHVVATSHPDDGATVDPRLTLIPL